MNYVPLYIKTSYSLLSSLCDIEKLILKCKELNIKKIAITDENLYGAFEFYKICKKNNIKPIIGLEVIIDNNKILLYAKNYKGYQNLTQIIYKKQNEELKLNDILLEDIIIVVTSKELYDLINSKNIYLIEDLKEILCLNKEDIKFLKYLYLIRDNKKLENIDEYNINEDCYLNPLNKQYKIENEIADKCNIEFKKNDLMPKYISDKKIPSKTLLFELCKLGLNKRLDNKVTDIYINRLNYELKTIDEMNFNDYFLIVYDIIKYCKQNDILVGPGRGSAAGSLVSYCLGITDVNPIQYDLLFERFLNPNRITMPDIDIDFDSNKRDQVIEYVINKYSKDKATLIITFSTLTNKQVIRDVGRILNINIKHLDFLSKNIIDYTDLTDNYKTNNVFSKYIRDNNLEELLNIATKLENLKRQISVHAAGIIISKENLKNYIPLEKYGNYYLSGFSMEHLEELGLLKMDLLGLKNLSLIDNVNKSLNLKNDFTIIDNEKTYNLFKLGLTEGIFQFESEGMKNFLKKLEPNTFEDLIAANALYRPGPSFNIDSYIKRKNNEEKIDYIHDDLEKILKSTYGIIIYQEQIIQIVSKIAGYTYSEADLFRRAIGKKEKEILINEEEKFITKSLKNGYTIEIAKKIYNDILKFANYGFNKSHSVAYAMISYKMAYLKSNYKYNFMAVLLTNSIGNDSKTKIYIDECKKMKIKILYPNINISSKEYIIHNDNIVFPISNIKSIGTIISKSIENNKPYKDIFEFVNKNYEILNKKTMENLIFSNAFIDFNITKKTLFNNIEVLLNYGLISTTVEQSLVEKPHLDNEIEFNKQYLSEKELEVFGFFLDSDFLQEHRKDKQCITTKEVFKNFDKFINIVLVVKNIKTINTKNNKKMAFINCIDEFDSTSIILFPNNYHMIENLNINNIIRVYGKVEKRMSNYQIVASKIEIIN